MKFFTLLLCGLSASVASSFHCSQGEIPDSNSICIEATFIEGCHKYATSETCQECQFRYRLNSDGKCEFSGTTNGPCCLQTNSSGQCTKCNVGLYVSAEGSCEQSTIIGCLEKNSKGNCINCSSGFILTKDGNCEKGIKECLEYAQTSKDSEKQCMSCKNGHSLINNACLKNKILGCMKEQNHSCSQCYEPFQEKQNHCEIANCVSYNEYGCTHCDCGFYLTPKNKCEELQKGCVRYQRGICTDCQSNFKLRGGACSIDGCTKMNGLDCLACSDKYENVNGSCKLKNCQIWNNDSCDLCQEGFKHFKGQCFPKEGLIDSSKFAFQ